MLAVFRDCRLGTGWTENGEAYALEANVISLLSGSGTATAVYGEIFVDICSNISIATGRMGAIPFISRQPTHCHCCTINTHHYSFYMIHISLRRGSRCCKNNVFYCTFAIAQQPSTAQARLGNRSSVIANMTATCPVCL